VAAEPRHEVAVRPGGTARCLAPGTQHMGQNPSYAAMGAPRLRGPRHAGRPQHHLRSSGLLRGFHIPQGALASGSRPPLPRPDGSSGPRSSRRRPFLSRAVAEQGGEPQTEHRRRWRTAGAELLDTARPARATSPRGCRRSSAAYPQPKVAGHELGSSDSRSARRRAREEMLAATNRK